MAAAILLGVIGAAFALFGFVQKQFRLPLLARWFGRAGLALGAAMALPLADELMLGGGRVLVLAPALMIAGAACWIFLNASAAAAIARAQGPAFSCMAIGLAGLAIASALAGATQAALAASGLCVLAVVCAGFDCGRGAWGETLALGLGAAGAGACLMAVSGGGLSPFTPALLFLPLLADALLASAQRNFSGGAHWFEIGARAGLARAHIGWAYWFISAHCAFFAVVASVAGRRAVGVDASRVEGLSAGLMQAASLAPLIAFAFSAIVLLRVSSVLRRFDAMRASGV
jgi:hypothetical protein